MLDIFLFSLQNHLASLKTILIRLQTQSRFLEMARENWSSASDLGMTGEKSYNI